MLREVTTRRASCIAFAMGLRDRLGAASGVRVLDAEMVRMVLDLSGLTGKMDSVDGDDDDEEEEDDEESEEEESEEDDEEDDEEGWFTLVHGSSAEEEEEGEDEDEDEDEE